MIQSHTKVWFDGKTCKSQKKAEFRKARREVEGVWHLSQTTGHLKDKPQALVHVGSCSPPLGGHTTWWNLCF